MRHLSSPESDAFSLVDGEVRRPSPTVEPTEPCPAVNEAVNARGKRNALALMRIVRGHNVRVQPLAPRGSRHGRTHAYQPSVAVGGRGSLGNSGVGGCGGGGGMALGGMRVRLYTHTRR